jgi:hypothetical protein
MLDTDNLFGDDQPPPVDTSGKPVPKNVRAIIDTGLEIPCALKYDGIRNNLRKYLVIAEIDWYKHRVKTLIIGEWPSDVQLALFMGKHVNPETWHKTEAFKYSNQMEIVIEKRIAV